MAQHRKISAKRRKHTGGLAVITFLGLSIAAAPIAAASDTDSGSGNVAGGPSSAAGSTGSAGSTGEASSASAEGATAPDSNAGSDGAEADDAASDDAVSEDAGSDDAVSEDAGSDGAEAGDTGSDDAGSDDAASDDAGSDGSGSDVVGESDETASDGVESGDDGLDEAEPEPDPAGASDDAVGTDAGAESGQPAGFSAPVPEAGADSGSAANTRMMTSSAEIDVPGVESMAAAPAPEPWAPTTVFATNNTFIKTLNNIGYWIESVFPAYKPVPLIPPAQVAKQVYETVQSIFNNSLVNGKPTPLSIPVYVLMVAAYQRYYELGNNHLPTATYTQSQTLLTVSGNIDLHDQDGDLVIATLPLSGQASKGVVLYEALTGLYTYTTLDPGMLAHGGTDSFTITLDDSLGSLNHPLGLHTTTVTIPINYQGAGNNAPLWAPTFGATDPMGVIRGNVGAWDIDGDELTYSLANSANGSGATATSSYTNNGGIVNLDSDGSFTYIPKDSFLPSLADWFTVTVDDGWGGASDIPVILPFTNLNVAAKETGTDPDDGAVSGKLVTTILGIPTNNSLPANDLALFTYTGTTPARGSVTFNPDATFTYTPTPAARHQAAGSGPDTDSFKIIGVDGSGRTLQLAEVTVDISPTNTPPTGGAFSITSVNAGNGVVTGSVTGTDDDGDTLAFGSGNILFPQLITTAQLNTVNINPDGTFTFSLNLLTGDLQRHTAAKDNATTGEKTDTFTVQMNDGHGGTADIGVTVPIAPKNTNPVMTTGVPPLIKTKTASWTFVAPTDADLDLLDWVLTGPPANGSVSWLLGTVTYTSNGGSIFSKGPDDSFEITVYDGHGGSDAATFHY